MHNNIVLFTGDIFTSVFFPISKPHLVADPGFDLRGAWTLSTAELFFLTVANVCTTSSCHNGGVCSSKNGSYTCACATGYTGVSCETGNDIFDLT